MLSLALHTRKEHVPLDSVPVDLKKVTFSDSVAPQVPLTWLEKISMSLFGLK